MQNSQSTRVQIHVLIGRLLPRWIQAATVICVFISENLVTKDHIEMNSRTPSKIIAHEKRKNDWGTNLATDIFTIRVRKI